MKHAYTLPSQFLSSASGSSITDQATLPKILFSVGVCRCLNQIGHGIRGVAAHEVPEGLVPETSLRKIQTAKAG
jgi:hypothetical protein